MRRVLLLSILLLSTSIVSAQTSWSPVAELVAKSIVYLEGTSGSCTGFVINAEVKEHDEDLDYILTAAHCQQQQLFADQQPTQVAWKDTKKDLMVLKVEDLHRPALKLARENPKIGEEVASYGFGYGLERPIFRIAHISDDRVYIPEGGIGGPLFALDSGLVPGQSGGPVVNARGEVVMIVQLTTQYVGLGAGTKTLDDKVGKFFGK